MDYTPYATKRDHEILKYCENEHIRYNIIEDVMLNRFEQIKEYRKFTSFYNTSKKIKVNLPVKNNYTNYYNKAINSAKNIVPSRDIQRTSRHTALKILNKNYSKYKLTRNIPSIDTTKMSHYLKFGLISIREAYYSIKNSTLRRQLFWRDFYYRITYSYPSVIGNAFYTKYNKIKWSKKGLSQWMNGTTGFPIVDAGMRQLNKIGWMHGRVRMITASFLCKDLHIDWRIGERYFAQKLMDYDPSINNGNWQWIASTGADHQPYFRIFNPWLQSYNYDKECKYIKKWIPELALISNNEIHKWYKYYNIKIYPKPMLDHSIESLSSIKTFKSINH